MTKNNTRDRCGYWRHLDEVYTIPKTYIAEAFDVSPKTVSRHVNHECSHDMLTEELKEQIYVDYDPDA